jgi:signal transduction histidine kinase
MKKVNKPAACQPIQVPIIYRVYAVTFGLAGLFLLWWGPGKFAGEMGGTLLSGPVLVRAIAVGVLSNALYAAVLAFAKNSQGLQRSLFWFALVHFVAWLALIFGASWVWRPGLGDSVLSVVGTLAWLLFYGWLAAVGEFPQTPFEASELIGIPGTRAREPLRSQYETKIRQAAAQEERNRLARDLHDSIKQQIFAIQTAAATAQIHTEKARFDGSSTAAREALDQIRSSARDAMTEMEVMLDQLRAEPLEHTGLVEALKKLCETIGFRTGAQVEFKLGEIPPAGTLAPNAAEATLRAAQEALANVARHARASHVWVSLESADGQLKLTVKDDGAGFDPQQDSRGMGTTNMRTRAEELGGNLALASRPAEGTTVTFSIPYAAPAPPPKPSQYRKRALSFGLFVVGILFHRQTKHWNVAPAILFTAALAVFHYIKTNGGARKLSVTTA